MVREEREPGILSPSYCFSFIPSEIAKKLYYYPFWLGHYFCASNYYKKRDYYPMMLLVYVRHGDFFLEYVNQKFFVGKGQAFLIDCHKPHYYHASENLEFVYIHFEGCNSAMLCEHITSQYGVIFDGEKARQIGDLILQLAERHDRDEILDAPEFSMAIYQLITLLVARNTEMPSNENPVDITMKYIQDHVGKKITLDELADFVGLSKYHYAHLFKSETGYSPIEYVINTRLNKAKVLLRTTAAPVSEIAYMVGYDNPGSFINLFCGKEGYSPTAFRHI